MRHLVITPCTDRKKHQPPSSLRARNLALGHLDDVVEAWATRIREANSQSKAKSLYSGRSFKEAADAASLLGAGHWIISAGLGLIDGDAPVPAYGLTVSPTGMDSVRARIHRGCWSAPAWWSALRAKGIRKQDLCDVFDLHPRALILVALSENYAEMLGGDLAALDDGQQNRLRIFGIGLNKTLPHTLHRCLMPYDRRLNGPDSPIPGTMSDFATRALHHFSRLRKDGLVGLGDPESDTEVVQGLMRNWRLPYVPQRQSKSNGEIKGLIATHWGAVDGKSGRMLRHLRDELKVACEQGRFQTLFKEVATQRKALEGDLI